MWQAETPTKYVSRYLCGFCSLVDCMGGGHSSVGLAQNFPAQQGQPSSWADLPAEVLQLVSRLLPSADCWTLRSVASGWASAIRSVADIQLTLHSEPSKIKSKFVLARSLQARYPHVQFIVRVQPPLDPLECIYLLRALKYQVSTALSGPWQQQTPESKDTIAGTATY